MKAKRNEIVPTERIMLSVPQERKKPSRKKEILSKGEIDELVKKKKVKVLGPLILSSKVPKDKGNSSDIGNKGMKSQLKTVKLKGRVNDKVSRSIWRQPVESQIETVDSEGNAKEDNKTETEKTPKLMKRKVNQKHLGLPPKIVLKGKRVSVSNVKQKKLKDKRNSSASLTHLEKSRNSLRKSGTSWKEIQQNKINHDLQIGMDKKPGNMTSLLKQFAKNHGSEISLDKISDAVKTILLILEDKNTNIFSDEGQDIYLQIASFKVPIASPREIRIILPHSLLPNPPDVCLFTSDLQKGKRVDHEPTLEHFKNVLKEKRVKQITEIITLRQLKTEYDQYELKRALCSRFDIFLSEAKVCGHITHLLGKTFFDRRKVPVPISLDAKDLKKRVEIALHKTSFRLSGKGTIFSVKVAHTLLTPKQIEENIMATINALHGCFPGGWENILQLMLKGARSISVPFYLSTMNDNEIKNCIIEPLRPKAAQDVIGELAGVGSLVVRPSGDIVFLENEEQDEHEQEVIKEQIAAKQQREKEKWERKRKAKGQMSEDDDDDDINEEDLINFAKRSRLLSKEEENAEISGSEDVMEEEDDEDDDEQNISNEEENISDEDDDDNQSERIGSMESKYLRNWAMSKKFEKEKKKVGKEVQNEQNSEEKAMKQMLSENSEEDLMTMTNQHANRNESEEKKKNRKRKRKSHKE